MYIIWSDLSAICISDTDSHDLILLPSWRCYANHGTANRGEGRVHHIL